ncbi:sensor histidine kinase [Daejeonella sp.]|uniref:sensor histidine kinase n=1 Tax=Daejeonella sp. TaxID=2805397 RepID=UPI00272F178E|nr:histidine kinase [Daejeonella sp.]MDP2415207.1 histidine kinase [Daejeonella sp.]
MESGNYFKDKYTRIEIAFFITYYLLFPVLTAIEVHIFEPYPGKFNIGENLLYGIIGMVPPWICYKIVIKGYLFNKKYLKFFLSFILYLALSKYYDIGIYLLISKISFLPADVIEQAARSYSINIKYNLGHFVSVYMLRELIVLSALAYFIRSARQDKQIGDLKEQQLQSELNYLKVQLQPHFFFNTLNNIYALTLQRSEKAAPLVAKHSEMMRYILYESSQNTVSLKKEIGFLRNYVEVEALRHSDKIDISFDTQGINELVLIEPLLLLPFVENTFKHGIREETSEGYVHVIISLVENELFMEISNSKPAMVKQETKGIGLQNAARRLDILYPDRYKLDVKNNDDSYELRLTLIVKTDD